MRIAILEDDYLCIQLAATNDHKYTIDLLMAKLGPESKAMVVKKITALSVLPNEIICKMMREHLSLTDASRLARTNHRYAGIFKDYAAWSLRFENATDEQLVDFCM